MEKVITNDINTVVSKIGKDSQPFNGTIKVHQFTLTTIQKNIIQFNEMSSYDCHVTAPYKQ